MDQYTRRIIGFGIHAGTVEGVTLCRMFKQAIRGAALPKYFSSVVRQNQYRGDAVRTRMRIGKHDRSLRSKRFKRYWWKLSQPKQFRCQPTTDRLLRRLHLASVLSGPLYYAARRYGEARQRGIRLGWTPAAV